MFDRMPNILGVTFGKLFTHPVGFPKAKLNTKFEVSNWSSFEDTFDRMRKIWGVTWRRPRLFWGSYLCARSDIPRRSCVPNL